MMIMSRFLLLLAVVMAFGFFSSPRASSSSRVLTELESSQVFGAQGFLCAEWVYGATCQIIPDCTTTY